MSGFTNNQPENLVEPNQVVAPTPTIPDYKLHIRHKKKPPEELKIKMPSAHDNLLREIQTQTTTNDPDKLLEKIPTGGRKKRVTKRKRKSHRKKHRKNHRKTGIR